MRVQKNYQKMLEATIAGLKEQNRVPTLLLHSCCAPCSSYCLEYLSQYFHITVDYYNPNIYPEEEYHMRVQEQQRRKGLGYGDRLRREVPGSRQAIGAVCFINHG